MHRFDNFFLQLVMREGSIPLGCERKLEEKFTQLIRENGCPPSETYDGYKKEFMQEVMAKGFQLKAEQISFNYDIHLIKQDGDKDAIGSFFYSVHPFFLGCETLWHAFGIFGSWKTGELYHYRADNKCSIPPDQEYVISREICNMLNEAVTKGLRNSEPEALEVSTENPFTEWDRSTEADIQYLSLIYLGVGAYGIRQNKLTLLIPIRSINGELVNLQRVYSDGSSVFQLDNDISGCFHRIGNPIDKTIYIAGTYTSSAQFHERRSHAVAVAFCKENMENVKAVLQEKYPDYELRFVPNNDQPQEIDSSSDPALEE